MSKEGKLERGKMWYSQRSIDGVLPDGIANDEVKMADVNYYLESLKVEDIQAGGVTLKPEELVSKKKKGE